MSGSVHLSYVFCVALTFVHVVVSASLHLSLFSCLHSFLQVIWVFYLRLRLLLACVSPVTVSVMSMVLQVFSMCGLPSVYLSTCLYGFVFGLGFSVDFPSCTCVFLLFFSFFFIPWQVSMSPSLYTGLWMSALCLLCFSLPHHVKVRSHPERSAEHIPHLFSISTCLLHLLLSVCSVSPLFYLCLSLFVMSLLAFGGPLCVFHLPIRVALYSACVLSIPCLLRLCATGGERCMFLHSLLQSQLMSLLLVGYVDVTVNICLLLSCYSIVTVPALSEYFAFWFYMLFYGIICLRFED